MLALPLHTGTEHPDLTLLVFSSIMLFFTGLGIGLFRERVDEFVREIVPGLRD
jgi:hypothetical protein